jgi:hypothetical protein
MPRNITVKCRFPIEARNFVSLSRLFKYVTLAALVTHCEMTVINNTEIGMNAFTDVD